MPVPEVHSFLLPYLQTLADGKELRDVEIREHVAESLRLTPTDRQEMMPSGRYTKLNSRVYQAMRHLVRAELVKSQGGFRQLTPEGKRLLEAPPPHLDLEHVRTLPAYQRWQDRGRASGNGGNSSPSDAVSEAPPEEVVENAFQRVEVELQADLLTRVRQSSPSFFEQVVIDLLIAMGYGGGDAARGAVTGRSGDGGIDGAIKEDALGLDEVYVQAKKYAEGNTVGEGDVRNFVGAIDVANATKGVFVTTAGFTKPAKAYVSKSSKRIVLIDGQELARLMVQYGIGVRTRQTYRLKRMDEDYFDSGLA